MSVDDLTDKDKKKLEFIQELNENGFLDEMLKSCKQYLNIDFSDDNELISNLIVMSVEYLLNAGVKYQEYSILYKQLISLLVFNFYEKRDNEKMNIFISNMINQLRYSQDV